MNKELLNKKIEDTLNIAEGINRAEANPFIYFKILDKIRGKKNKEAFSLRQNSYVFKFAVLLIAALLLNVYTYFSYPKTENPNNDTNTSREENLKSFAKEYSITGTTYNY